MAEGRETITSIYVRVCEDSGFGLDAIEAAQLTARIVGCHPLDVWTAMSGLDAMDAIASGEHPCVRRAPQEASRD